MYPTEGLALPKDLWVVLVEENLVKSLPHERPIMSFYSKMYNFSCEVNSEQTPPKSLTHL